MYPYVRNVTSSTIVICDLNDIPLPPNDVVNLLLYAKQKDIDDSDDLALCLNEGYIQTGTWEGSKFVIRDYHKIPDRTNLDDIGIVILDTISGYPTTCSSEFPVSITAPLQLSDNVDFLNNSILNLTSIVSNLTIDGNLTIEGNVDIIGDLTAPTIYTNILSGIEGTGSNCNIDVLCNLNFNNNQLSNVKFYPRIIEQDNEPSNGTNSDQIDNEEMLIWIDTNDNDRVYFMYNYNANIVKIELT